MRLSGCITALATPLTLAGEIDLPAWRRLLELQLEAGIDGVVVGGSTGESASLFHSEFDLLLRTAVEVVAGRVPVIAGTGQSSTARTIEQTRRSATLGADAALVVTPPYVRPTQAGLEAHYRAIADDGALPLMLYNVPPRTGCDMLPGTVAALAGHDRIVGIKEARSEPERVQALVALRGPRFTVLSGDDPGCAGSIRAGADGVISVASNVAPFAMRLLCRQAGEGRAAELEERLQPLFAFAGIEPNPIPVKALLTRLGIGHGLRLPLLPLSRHHEAEAARILGLVEQIEHTCRDTLAA